MSWLKGVSAVTYAVNNDTIRQWAWFWIEGLGGELVSQNEESRGGGLKRWTIDMGAFDTVLLVPPDQAARSGGNAPDHSVFSIDYAVEDLASLNSYLDQHPQIGVLGTPMGTQPGSNFVQRSGPGRDKAGGARSHLKRIDHVTYAVTPDSIEECARFWVDGMGGTMVLKNDDVRAEDSADSMMLWGIVLNKGVLDEEFGIALVAGIDREQVSQVTRFVSKNGPNMVQHVAYDVGDMTAFRRHFEGDFGANLLSETLVVPDGFGGLVKQVFGRGYEAGNAAEVVFPEFLERLDGSGKGFTNAAGEGLYERVQRTSDQGDDTPIIDFSKMPPDWEPPAPQRKAGSPGKLTAERK